MRQFAMKIIPIFISSLIVLDLQAKLITYFDVPVTAGRSTIVENIWISSKMQYL